MSPSGATVIWVDGVVGLVCPNIALVGAQPRLVRSKNDENVSKMYRKCTIKTSKIKGLAKPDHVGTNDQGHEGIYIFGTCLFWPQ